MTLELKKFLKRVLSNPEHNQPKESQGTAKATISKRLAESYTAERKGKDT
jgi:hypothetical protein